MKDFRAVGFEEYETANVSCYWTYDDNDECWDTDCDERFQFRDGTPLNNGFKYCPYCGRELVTKS